MGKSNAVPSSNRPNVLLVMCDQFRGDCLGIDGHPDVKTPYLDTLAADGVLFENAYSACPSCIPARAGLFTGKTPRHHGRVGYQDGIDWNYDHMLAQEMRDGGYQTAVVGKMHVHPPRLGCGFEHMRLHDGYIGHYRKANLPHWMHQTVSDDYVRFLKNGWASSPTSTVPVSRTTPGSRIPGSMRSACIPPIGLWTSPSAFWRRATARARSSS